MTTLVRRSTIVSNDSRRNYRSLRVRQQAALLRYKINSYDEERVLVMPYRELPGGARQRDSRKDITSEPSDRNRGGWTARPSIPQPPSKSGRVTSVIVLHIDRCAGVAAEAAIRVVPQRF